jgi:hypothetical protein
MKRLVLSIVAAGAMSTVLAVPALALNECVRNNDACLSVDDGTATATVDVGAVDAEANVGVAGGGVTADAGAVDVQAGTDREDCADAGAINVPPEQAECPPSN